MLTRSALWSRVLPPVVVLGAVGAFLVPPLLRRDDALAREKEAIRIRIAVPAERGRVIFEAQELADRHPSEETQWFAIETLGAVHAVRPAVERWAASPERRSSRAAAQRLARVLLSRLSHGSGPEAAPTALFPQCMQALTDVGDADARATLDRWVSTMPLDALLPLYRPVHRTPSPAVDVLATSLEKRTEVVEMVAAAAVLRARPGERAGLSVLKDRAASPWRVERPFFWQHVVRAVGLCGGAEQRAFLATERERATGDALDQARRTAFDVALALADDPDAPARVRDAARDPRNEWATTHWAIGLGVRLSHGDGAVVPDLVRLWDDETVRVAKAHADAAASGRPGPTDQTRLQIGMSVLLAEREPPKEVPADRWAETLAVGSTHVARALGHAWAFRRRAPDGLAMLVDDLLSVVRSADVTAPDKLDADETAAFCEILRAFLRWA